ncbi:MAG: pyridoxamine 5'-phosphate oxidase family protein [Nocardioides sp.]|uniref:pyridoxamine 5'-phosphate oxidase family protein n=1 Tax=Nocardioides sp. TaxID=35761 RepID=UPI0039E2C384
MTHLEELTTERAWELAATVQISRIGWTGPGGPAVVPVNHAVHDGVVWIRTSAHSALAAEVDESQVALLVDHLDATTHVGWSVQFRGRAEILYHEDQVDPAVLGLHSWPSGARPLWIRLRPEQVNGRELVAD